MKTSHANSTEIESETKSSTKTNRRLLDLRVVTVVMAIGVLGAVPAHGGVNIETVHIGNAGNPGDPRYSGTIGFGGVSYGYNIGKYEVTAGQYTAFLNAVAATDTYNLYHTSMAHTQWGSGISRSGSAGSYTYSVDAAFVHRPVNYVSWRSAARFANWMSNGQPVGAQDATTTESGSYSLNGAMTISDVNAVTRDGRGGWFIPTEDEWYKAAYYDPALNGGSAGYWDYPTGSNTSPGRSLADASGNNANHYISGVGNYPIDSGKYTTLVGEFQNSASPYGTFDQGGNVREWNESLISDFRGIRGGSFYPLQPNDPEEGYLHAANGSVGVPIGGDNTTGFRLVYFESIGTVAAGSATVTRSGATSVLHSGDPILEGDLLETDAGESISLLFVDETSFEIGPNARLVIDEYVYDPGDPEQNKSKFSWVRGLFNYTSGLIGRGDPEDVEIETVVFGIGIRGTEFTAEIESDTELVYVTLSVTNGAIVWENYLTGETQEVNAGESVNLTAPVPTLNTIGFSVNSGAPTALNLWGYTDAPFIVQRSTNLYDWNDWMELSPANLPAELSLMPGKAIGGMEFFRLRR